VRGEDELRMRPLVRLFLTLAVGQLISKPPIMVNGEERIPHRWRMVLAIDELASLGELEPLELALSKSAGAGITGLLLTQDHEQVIKEYGSHETITSHCRIVIAFAPNNQPTAEWLSKACGQATEVYEDVTETLNNGKKSQNRGFRASPKPLLSPDELRQLKQPEKDNKGTIVAPGELLVIVGGQVIKGTQSLGFRDPELTRRMSIAAPGTMRIFT
jgi:type IV secretion system protein VirD4